MMKMLRRCLVWLLALGCTCGSGFAEIRNAILLGDGSTESQYLQLFDVIEDARGLLVLAENAGVPCVLQYESTEAAPVSYEIQFDSAHAGMQLCALAYRGAQLVGLGSDHSGGYTVFELNFAERAIQAAATIGFRTEEDDRFYQCSFFYCGDQLYLIFPLSERIYRVAADGTQNSLVRSGLCGGCPVDAERALLAVRNSDALELYALHADGSIDSTPAVYALAENASGMLSGFSACGNEILFACGTDICALSTSESGSIRTGGAASIQSTHTICACAWGGHAFVQSDGSILQVIQTDAGNADAVQLTLGGIRMDAALTSAYMTREPSVRLQFLETADDLISSVLSRNPEPDILILGSLMDANYYTLFYRNYLAEITDDRLKTYVGEMYPELQKWVTSEGKLFGLPIQIVNSQAKGYNPELLARIGAEVPKDWPAFLAFLKRWEAEGENYPEIRLLESTDPDFGMAGDILSRILNDYDEYALYQEVRIGYDTECFRALLSGFEAIDFEKIDRIEADKAEDCPALFSFDYNCTLGFLSDSRYKILPMAVADDVNANIGFNFTVAVINPFTKNFEEAQRFLAFLAENLSPEERIMMCPGENAAVARDNSGSIAALQEMLEAYQKQYADAEPADQPLIQAAIEATEASVRAEQENVWEVSAEEIAEYRQAAQYMCIDIDTGLFGENAAMYDELFTQYLQGAIDTDTYIQKCEAYSSMQQLEQ